jgi:hypothetical protein
VNANNSSYLKSDFTNHLYPGGAQHQLNLGDASVTFQALGNCVTVDYSVNAAFPVTRKKTLVFKDEVQSLKANFSVPNLPLVLKLGTALEIDADATYEARISIPVFLTIYPSDKLPDKGVQVPTRYIRHSWYGDFSEGELVHYRELGDLNEKSAHLPELEASCKITITNSSKEVLLIKKLCIQTEYLALYLHDGELMASPLSIFYKGGNEPSSIRVNGVLPEGCHASERIADPRVEFRGSPRLRSFGRFLEFAGLKFLVE